MKIDKIEKNGVAIASVTGDEIVIKDTASALELLMTVKYDIGTNAIVLPKEMVIDEFFILSSGIAGEILQK